MLILNTKYYNNVIFTYFTYTYYYLVNRLRLLTPPTPTSVGKFIINRWTLWLKNKRSSNDANNGSQSITLSTIREWVDWKGLLQVVFLVSALMVTWVLGRYTTVLELEMCQRIICEEVYYEIQAESGTIIIHGPPTTNPYWTPPNFTTTTGG